MADSAPVLTERKWSLLTRSVTGASHRRAGLPNQDAVLVQLAEGSELPAVLAVSDGHGSEKCFRSHEGSRLAVNVAVKELLAFYESTAGLNPREVHRNAEQLLPRAIARKWREAILAHHSEQPIADSELEHLSDSKKAALRSDAAVAYGATLVAVLVSREFIICLQLGDGEILIVSEKTLQVDRPMEADESLIANETTSLCQEEAWQYFRFRFQYFVDSAPALILLATDGYPNSFATPAGFVQVATDLLQLIETDGIEQVADSLPGWLDEASSQGSGDDVSVAILHCKASGIRAAKSP